MNDERVETIISVKEREEEKQSDEGENTDKKKDAKTGDKKEGELVKKEKAEEGALSFDIFKRLGSNLIPKTTYYLKFSKFWKTFLAIFLSINNDAYIPKQFSKWKFAETSVLKFLLAISRL